MANGMVPCSCPLRTKIYGFAYLWVLLLVAIMGAGLGVGAEIYITATQRDKEAELLAIGHQFRWAIKRYYEVPVSRGQVSGKGDYPLSLEEMLQDSRSAGTKRHLRKIFVDPMTGKAEWGVVRIGGRIVGVHSLSEKTPIKQENFEAEDMAFRAKLKHSDWVFAYPADIFLHMKAEDLNPTTTVSPITVTGKPVLNSSMESSTVERAKP